MVATFLLIGVGGNVTSKGVGMSVPDWPTSFGSFNPAGWTRNMDGAVYGVRDEHFHRLMGATVGVLVIILTGWLLAFRLAPFLREKKLVFKEPRAWVRRLGLASLLAVIVQGLMGGFRVTEISLVLAIIHGCFAQAVFCLLIALAMALSPHWPRAGVVSPAGSAALDLNRRLRLWTMMLTGAVYLQLVLGAIFRHTGVGVMGIVHVGGALVVGSLLIQAANYSMGRPESDRLSRLTIGLFLLYGVQVVLGVASYLAVLSMNGRNPAGVIQTYAPTLHVAVGAVILGTSFALALRSVAVTGGRANSAFDVRMTEGEVLA